MVKDLLGRSKDFLFQEQKTILSAAFIISGMSLTASLLGLIKMRLYAGILGAGLQFDTFVAAFKLPDFIFQLIVVGSLNAAFIPLFSEIITKNDARSAWRFASNILNISLLLFSFVSLIIFIFAGQLTTIVAAGFDPSQTKELIDLIRIMLLSPILLGVSSFISGSLQSFKRFLIPFLAPIVYNFGAIFGVLFLYQPLGLKGLAWGVVLGSFLHLLIQIPLLLHLGFHYQPSVSFKDDLSRKMFFLSVPRTLGLAAEQIKAVILVNLASLLPSGAISVMRFGESIATVPVSLFGAAIAQASLPTLSHEAMTDLEKLKETFLSSFHEILYLSVPSSIILIVLKIPVVRLILGVGRFDWNATVATAWVLAILAMSLFAQSLVHLIVRTFYALQDTKTPLFISIASVIVSLAFSVYFSSLYQVRGLVLGVTIGSILEFMALFFFLDKRLSFDKWKIIGPSFRIFLSSFVMALTIYIPVKILDQVFLDTNRTVNLIILVWLVLTLGISTYLLLTWLMGCREIKIFFKILLRLKNLRENITSLSRLPFFLNQ